MIVMMMMIIIIIINIIINIVRLEVKCQADMLTYRSLQNGTNTVDIIQNLIEPQLEDWNIS